MFTRFRHVLPGHMLTTDDVADYRNVDPRIGTLEDFDEMMAAFKKVNIKCFVDIVPNHSSDDHVWFQEALKSPKGSNARARYHFYDGELAVSGVQAVTRR